MAAEQGYDEDVAIIKQLLRAGTNKDAEDDVCDACAPLLHWTLMISVFIEAGPCQYWSRSFYFSSLHFHLFFFNALISSRSYAIDLCICFLVIFDRRARQPSFMPPEKATQPSWNSYCVPALTKTLRMRWITYRRFCHWVLMTRVFFAAFVYCLASLADKISLRTFPTLNCM